MVSMEFYIDTILLATLWPGVNSASNKNEYQEYILWGKGGRCVRLTTLPPSCAKCLEIWKPQPPGTVKACPGLQGGLLLCHKNETKCHCNVERSLLPVVSLFVNTDATSHLRRIYSSMSQQKSGFCISKDSQIITSTSSLLWTLQPLEHPFSGPQFLNSCQHGTDTSTCSRLVLKNSDMSAT